MQQAGLLVPKRTASVPSLYFLGFSNPTWPWEAQVVGVPEKPSQPCLSPLFDLELDAKLAVSSNRLADRCFSQQQIATDVSPGTSLLQQILAACRCSSPVQAQLLQQLQLMRHATPRDGLGSHSCISSSSHDAACTMHVPGATRCDPEGAGTFVQPTAVDIEAMACELLAMGYMVQVRDGAQHQERSKTPRSCLQNLRHRFIVCLGVRPVGDGEPNYLPQPLVVEPRFREQFTIAHPTSDYEALLQSLPPCFVGPVANLELVVKLICEQMTAAFKLQGLPVPPWRTRTALLSKWSTLQLAELADKIASLRRLSVDVQAAGRIKLPCPSHEQLYNSDRPAAANADHAAVGSAPTNSVHLCSPLQAYVAAVLCQREEDCPSLLSQLGVDVPTPLMPTAAFSVANHVNSKPSNRIQQDMEHHALQEQLQRNRSSPHAGEGIKGCSTTCSAQGQTTQLGGQAPSVSAMHTGLVQLSPGNTGTPAAGAALKFTRKASAEWKHQRNISRNIRGMLAAALNKSPSEARSNVPAVASSERAGGQPVVGVAPAGTSAALPSTAGVDNGSDAEALIRRTQFRAACDEPWRQITTVRLGAYSQQQQTHHSQI